MNRANGQRIIRRVWMGNTSVKDLRAEIATKRTFSSNEREAMVRATIRSALDGILRRSEFLEQVYAVFLQPICSALPTLRNHSTERKTRKLKLTGTALKQPKTAGNKSVTQDSQSKSFLFDIFSTIPS